MGSYIFALLVLAYLALITAKCCSHTKQCAANAACYSCTSGGSYETETSAGEDPISTACTNKICSTGVCLTNSIVTGGVKLDPHFYGLNGKKFDFQGEPEKVFALISDKHVQVNARFLPWRKSTNPRNATTVLGSVCVRFCNDTITVNGSGYVTRSYVANPDLIVTTNGSLAHIAAGLWTMDVMPVPGHRLHFLNLLNVNLLHRPFAGLFIHGILGATAPSIFGDRALPKKTGNCKNNKEGGCELEGNWRDYEIEGNELCGTTFKYSQFDADFCVRSNIVKRGDPDVPRSLVQQAEESILQ